MKALDAILAKEDIGGITANFVRLVTVKRRLFSIRDMIGAYGKLYDASRGVTHAEVTSATALSDENLAALKDQLRGASAARRSISTPGLIPRSSAASLSGSVRAWSTARSEPSSTQFA